MSEFGFWIFAGVMIVLFYGEPDVMSLIHKRSRAIGKFRVTWIRYRKAIE